MPQVSAFLLQTLSLSGYIPVLSIWCIIKVIGLIRKNVECGRIAGPFPSPPLTNFRCSPLGAVPKKSGGIRIINDLSWQVKKSINEFVSPDDFSLSYMSVDAAVRRIQLFDDPYISKHDIASAFTYIIVHTSDWNLLGFKWRNQYYFSMCLVFDCRSSPFLYNQFADALEFMAKSRGSSNLLDHYVDGSFTVEASAKKLRNSDLIFQETATKAGWELQHKKCTMPSKVEELLGIVIDIPNSELRMSCERQSEILHELEVMSHVKVVTKKKLLSLIGKLSFITKVVRSGRTFLRRLINLEDNLKKNPDPIFVQTIIDGIRFGVKIGYDGPQMSLECDNWPSSLEHYDEVSEIIRKNVDR